MPEIELRDPLFLLVGLLAPLVYLLAARLPSVLVYSDLVHVESAPRSLRARLARLPALLLALATLVLSVALAGPRTGDATTHVMKEGIALVLSVDRSGSMNARDFVAGDASVSRLDAVRNVIHEFVEGGEAGAGREGDLMGLVVFGTFADGLCPLTLDHANLLNILDEVKIATEATEAATAVGEGLGLAIERLREHPAKSKVIILLTDGVNNAGVIDPLQAAKLAADNNIKVYTIAAGTNGFAPIPILGHDGREYLRRVYVEMDKETLEQIAKITGGRYFHARDVEGLKEVYREIDRLERTEVSEVRYLQYREHYPPLVVLALLLAATAALASGTVLRRLP
ncbi:MAG TPA: VWA domain-containing protein [Candidatus Limnocylindrales bacterium]|nr:VWA domain-containing protein [Candidatus Limnocylindrales bacterium]